MSGDSVQPEYISQVRDPETGDWSQGGPLSEDLNHAPSTELAKLNDMGDYGKNGFPPNLENFREVTFQEVLSYINPSFSITKAGRENRCPTFNDITAPEGQAEYDKMDVGEFRDVSGGAGLPGKWGTVKDEIERATAQFSRALDSLMNDSRHWDGQTKLKAFENVRSSFVAPEKISASAGGLKILVDAFTKTVDYVYKNIEGNRPNYEYNIQLTHDEDYDDYVNQFNNFAREVMGGHYSDNIRTIASNNPAITTGKLPDLGGTPDPDPTARNQGQGLGLGDGGGGGGPLPYNGKPPKVPDFTDPKLPTTSTTDPTGTEDLPTAPEGLGDPTQAASNAVPPGLGSPAPAGGSTPNSVGKDPREGALGLGPKGLNGPLKKSGGAGGGGGGRGLSGAKPVAGRSASVPATPVARAGLGAATPAAGMAGGAGTPGMMPPHAGQGAGQNGKDHQVMKALKRKKTGEKVMGKADAVVPVVGESERPEPAQPEPEAVEPERRRVVDRPVQRIATGDVRQVP